MAKRFVDVQRYRKRFFRSLPAAYKLLWDYITLECDHAGIWHADFEVAEICIGSKINPDEAIKLFNADKPRIEIFERGKVWFIRSFVEFQYGTLNPENKVHKSVINRLSSYQDDKDDKNFKPLASPIQAPYQGAKEKDKDKDKDKTLGVGGSMRGGQPRFNFDPIWQAYPKRTFKKLAERYFHATVKTDQDYADIQKALANYLKTDTVRNGYIQNGSTWFNNWRDYIDFTEPRKDPYANTNKTGGAYIGAEPVADKYASLVEN